MIKLKNVRLDTDFRTKEPIELILEFNNNRNHAVQIEKGMTRNLLVNNLRVLADHLERDTHLDEPED